jgi:hypothetical protein
MKKMCVFCGKSPESKNKEHVLPQWLIAFTGDPKRTVRFGFNKQTGKSREYSYNAFQFPACAKCNNDFANLEHLVKPVILNLLDSQFLTNADFVILLDWFDKVRIGLWQAFLLLDKNPYQISPHYHIQSRMGLHDRMLQLCRLGESEGELSFRGCDMPSFSFTPNCFSMIINNYCIINLSSPFLFSRRLGFPYPASTSLLESGAVDYDMVPGRERVMRPLIRFPFNYNGTSIFQPIYRQVKHLSFYNEQYVSNNSLSVEHGFGQVFMENGDKARVINSAPSVDWVPSKYYTRDDLNPGISIHTLELQRFMNSLTPSLDQLSKENRLVWQNTIRIGDNYGRQMIKTLKKNSSQ